MCQHPWPGRIVEVADEGRQRLYRLNGHALKPIHDWVKNHEESCRSALACWMACSKTSSSWRKEMTLTSSGKAMVTLPTDKEILITREFDVPRHLVYRAWTTPELVKRWWSGHQGEMKDVEIDLRVGGKWRYVMVANEGFEVAFHGEYREIVPGERIVNTEIYEMPGADEEDGALNIVTFNDVDGRTTLSLLVQCPTREVRDGILESGMEVGMQEQMDLLEDLARSLR
jgi:uncharacterized protein YndB with AHSA1/START domain